MRVGDRVKLIVSSISSNLNTTGVVIGVEHSDRYSSVINVKWDKDIWKNGGEKGDVAWTYERNLKLLSVSCNVIEFRRKR